MVRIPAGYVVEAYATYDNTTNNQFNPNTPPQDMVWGDFTTEEMYVLFLQGVPYEEGDEDIVLSAPDPNTMVVYQHDNLFPAWPNQWHRERSRLDFASALAGRCDPCTF